MFSRLSPCPFRVDVLRVERTSDGKRGRERGGRCAGFPSSCLYLLAEPVTKGQGSVLGGCRRVREGAWGCAYARVRRRGQGQARR